LLEDTYKATQAVLLDEEVVPFQGKPQYDLQLMQNAFIFLQKLGVLLGS
jgi:hypothetical protein